jgi:hypothetical protein
VTFEVPSKKTFTFSTDDDASLLLFFSGLEDTSNNSYSKTKAIVEL